MAKILIIEDDDLVRKAFVSLFEDQDHEILTAESGEKGIELAKQKPDMILCDLLMPKMSGYEIAKKIKSQDSTRDIPLIALTALTIESGREKAVTAGFDKYIEKMIGPEEIINEIQHIYDKLSLLVEKTSHY